MPKLLKDKKIIKNFSLIILLFTGGCNLSTANNTTTGNNSSGGPDSSPGPTVTPAVTSPSSNSQSPTKMNSRSEFDILVDTLEGSSGSGSGESDSANVIAEYRKLIQNDSDSNYLANLANNDPGNIISIAQSYCEKRKSGQTDSEINQSLDEQAERVSQGVHSTLNTVENPSLIKVLLRKAQNYSIEAGAKVYCPDIVGESDTSSIIAEYKKLIQNDTNYNFLVYFADNESESILSYARKYCDMRTSGLTESEVNQFFDKQSEIIGNVISEKTKIPESRERIAGIIRKGQNYSIQAGAKVYCPDIVGESDTSSIIAEYKKLIQNDTDYTPLNNLANDNPEAIVATAQAYCRIRQEGNDEVETKRLFNEQAEKASRSLKRGYKSTIVTRKAQSYSFMLARKYYCPQ